MKYQLLLILSLFVIGCNANEQPISRLDGSSFDIFFPYQAQPETFSTATQACEELGNNVSLALLDQAVIELCNKEHIGSCWMNYNGAPILYDPLTQSFLEVTSNSGYIVAYSICMR